MTIGTVQISDNLFRKAEAHAKNQGLDISDIIQNFLESFLAKKNPSDYSFSVFNSVEEEDRYLDKLESQYFENHPEKLQEEIAGIESAIPATDVFKKAGLIQ